MTGCIPSHRGERAPVIKSMSEEFNRTCSGTQWGKRTQPFGHCVPGGNITCKQILLGVVTAFIRSLFPSPSKLIEMSTWPGLWSDGTAKARGRNAKT